MEKKITTVRIPRELYIQLEQIAFIQRKRTGQNVTITELILKAIEQLIATNERSN